MLKSLSERSFISPVVAYTFLPVALTGILLLFHLRAPGMKEIHEWVGLAFTVFCAFHLVINWKPFVKCLSKKGARTALILTLVLTLACGALGLTGDGGGEHRHAPTTASAEVIK